MASAITCLAINQKFNFSKLNFESMMKNLDNVYGKFLMYPRFVQLFLDQKLDDMSVHKRIYVAPSHTKKVFVNMRRVGKDFSDKITPLFPIMMVQAQQEQGESSAIPTDPQYTPIITQPSTSQPKKSQKPRKPKKKTEVPQPSGSTENVADEAVYKELDDSLAASNEAGSKYYSVVGPMCQDTMRDTIAQTRVRMSSKLGGKLMDIDKDAKSLTLLMILKEECEVSNDLIQVFHMNEKVDITLVNDQDDADMFGVNDLDGDEVIVNNVTLAELKSAKPKAVKVVIQEPEHGTTTTTPTTIIYIPKPLQDKGKGIMIEKPVVKQVKPMKRLDQMRLDKELAFKLQAEEEEEERLAREKAQQTEEANIAWDDVQAKTEADYQLAQKLQA
ncbi:hypothetical protein Tco_1490771 [Tanacetum coccineum]